METFSVLLAICAGNSPVAGEFPRTPIPTPRISDATRLSKHLIEHLYFVIFDKYKHAIKQ